VGLEATGVGATGGEAAEGEALTGLVARTPVRLTVEERTGSGETPAARPLERMYHFEVYGEHLWTTLRGWSPEPTCLWIPRKAGTYRIVVRVRDGASGGYEDVHTVAEDVVVGPAGG
jgi:hypothetical protein